MCAENFLAFHFILHLVPFAVSSLYLQAIYLGTHSDALLERGLKGCVCMSGWFSLNI